ncbi:uncharacterized protein MELLADRAFT_78734 [Melampsora larici-populina 98AG31]|uniref:Uncharacterized protein n=1 Tax=Melampsora larici-populina (strain 98AG31 / pathotype 3-4-7) TaxID=747676 RepID=F4RY23_MELLP|nr:uncharacterized protein MELLADRAFT_78734 [Melampsora larici-populina 98AG31]EGG02717.1 hypothetical protein MELLADRAFT_78734 [Melampsora larici-populina 98AG31]
MRPGLRSNEPPDGTEAESKFSYSSPDLEEEYHPPAKRRGQTAKRGQTRGAKRGGHAGSPVGREQRAQRDEQQVPSDDDHQLPDAKIEFELDSGENVILPNIYNFHELGVEWGRGRADEVLASLSLPKNNRPSSNGLFEAQALQSAYQLDKTMLCIVLKCSRHVLDEALLEGPLAREPNAYTNYQTYSVASTTTKIPPKGVSEGFPKRNVIVGNTWSTFQEEEKRIFSPDIFERLCVTTSEAYALTQTPRGIAPMTLEAPSEVTVQNKSDLKPLTDDELTRYVPIFKELVNLSKVSGDLREGRLWRHSGKSRSKTREQLMKLEITKVVRQLNVHFPLLVACWNPTTSTNQALFQDEHTSCKRWALMEKKVHLLERFSFEATKAPEHLRVKPGLPKTQSEAGARQALKRSELTKALNSLITPFLQGGVNILADAHPKVPNLKEGFAKKSFRGQVKLMFHRTPDSLVSDVMIAKGPSALSNDEVQIWLDDIHAKRYTIIQVKNDRKKGKNKAEDNLTKDEKELDDNDQA